MNKFLKTNLLALLAFTLLVVACKKEYESIQNVDDGVLKAYIAQNNLSLMQPDPNHTGFYYQVTNPDTGALFQNSDSVFYDITVKSLAGTAYFQNSANGNWGTRVGYLDKFSPSTGTNLVNFNIPALRTAVLALKPGGTTRILLPSYLGFGKNGSGPISSNENLDFTIKTYPFRSQSLLDDYRIQTFLTSKNLTATKDSSGIYYIVNAPGSGDSIDGVNSTVTVKYTGRTLDGAAFDSNDTGFSTSLLDVIRGWQILIPKFNVGTKFRMFVPSDLAYGPSETALGLKNAILDFDIEIVSVTN